MCVDLTHATTFATIDAEASSSLFSYSMMVLMALFAVLFFAVVAVRHLAVAPRAIIFATFAEP